jgi:hypothetical protein
MIAAEKARRDAADAETVKPALMSEREFSRWAREQTSTSERKSKKEKQ